MAFRAFVMLACLILVPLAAVFGSQCPEIVKSLLVDRVLAWINPAESKNEIPGAGDLVGGKHEPARKAANDSPRGKKFASIGSPDTLAADKAQPARLASHSESTIHHGVEPGSVQSLAAARQVAERSARAINQDSSDAVAAAPLAEGFPAMSPSPATGFESAAPPPGRATATPATEIQRGRPSGTGRDAAALAEREPSTIADPFAAIERKLRDYGAAYYLLEAWGADKEMYRFHCKMPLHAAGGEFQHFEAFDRDAVRAMRQVLEQIEQWRPQLRQDR